MLQNTANQTKLNNLKKSYLVLKDRVEAERQDAIQNLQGSKEYEQNLANEGFVVDDLSYKNKRTGEFVSIKTNPQIVTDSNYVLINVEMHTTKPIEIVFGNKSNLKKMTGPHRITISQTGNGSPRAVISPYSPFGAFYKTEVTRNTFKAYPHTPNLHLNKTKDPNEYEEMFINSHESAGSVCLGELAATASIGFNQNDPNYVVMAIKSFLQSVNASDYWGKDYVNFPNLNELNQKISFKQWRGFHQKNAFKSLKTCNVRNILFNKDKTRALIAISRRDIQKNKCNFLNKILTSAEIIKLKNTYRTISYLDLNIVKEKDHSYKITSIEEIINEAERLKSNLEKNVLQRFNHNLDTWENVIDTDWYEYDSPAIFEMTY